MRTIHRYRLFGMGQAEKIHVEMRVGAKPLCVGLDVLGTPSIWCEVDERVPVVARDVWVIGTGKEVPERATVYVGSFMLHGEMWHVYTR